MSTDRSELFHIPLPTTPLQKTITLRVAPLVLAMYLFTTALLVPPVGSFDIVHDCVTLVSGLAAIFSAIKPMQLKSRLLFITFGWSATLGRMIYVLVDAGYGIPQKWLVFSISAMFLTLSLVYVMAADYITIAGSYNE